MTITLEDMGSKLISLDTMYRELEKTNPSATIKIDGDSKIGFTFDPDWNQQLSELADTDPVDVTMTIDGTERALTKEAVSQAAANFGLSASYIRKLPYNLTQGLLNYHYGRGFGDGGYNVLAVGDNVSAFTRPSLTPYSNLQLLENVVAGVRERYGEDTPVFADYKYANSLQRTDVRLIVPAQQRIMADTYMDDIPEGGEDTWLSGIHLSNSSIGKTQTTMEAYMFRYWCTNGCTTKLDSVGTWNRRSGGDEDVYEWARKSVDEVLGGMDGMFDQVQALARLNVNGATGDILREIFSQYEVPVSQREAIMDRLLGMEHLTMYSIMQAITEAANTSGIDDRRRDRLMRIGGALPTTTFDTLKARVWREGHAAGDEAVNPYEPLVVA